MGQMTLILPLTFCLGPMSIGPNLNLGPADNIAAAKTLVLKIPEIDLRDDGEKPA